jgi:hypothetical protein
MTATYRIELEYLYILSLDPIIECRLVEQSVGIPYRFYNLRMA